MSVIERSRAGGTTAKLSEGLKLTERTEPAFKETKLLWTPEPKFSVYRVEGESGLWTIESIKAPKAGERTEITVINIGNNTIFWKDFTIGAEAANRIQTSTGINLAMYPNDSFTFYYDGTTKLWRDLGAQGFVPDGGKVGEIIARTSTEKYPEGEWHKNLFYDATLNKNVDPTGKTDSTTGLKEAYQKCINENRGLYIPGGKYVVGEGGTGFDISTLEYKETMETAIFSPPQIVCATNAWIRGHPNLKTKPVVAIKSPQTEAEKQFIAHNFQFGRISGQAIRVYANLTEGSKVVKGIVEANNLKIFEGKEVEAGAGQLAAGTKLEKVLNSTEVELSANALKTVTQNIIRVGGPQEGAGLYIGPGVVDGTINVQFIQEALYGILCESKEESAETKIGWVANNTITCQLLSCNGYGIYLKSPVKSESFGVQGNRFISGETIGGGLGLSVCKWGIVIDDEVNQNSRFNRFEPTVIETTTEGGIRDRNGATAVVANYLGVITTSFGPKGEKKQNYRLEEGAVGIPYVRAYMLEGFTAEGFEGIDLINYKEKVGVNSTFTRPVTGLAVRNGTGRPIIALIQTSPKATKLTAEVAVGKEVFNLTPSAAAGWVVGKMVTFSKVPTGTTTPVINQTYFIVSPEFAPTENTPTGTTKIKMTGAKEKGFLNKTQVQFPKLNAGVTTLKTGVTYWVKGEEAAAFEVSATENGEAIKVEGELVAAETKITRNLINGFELAEKSGGTPIAVAGHALTTTETEFSTPNLRFQLTGNSPIGTTLLTLKGASTKAFQGNPAGTYLPFFKWSKVTPGVTGKLSEVGQSFVLINAFLAPTSETLVGETKVNLKPAVGFPTTAERFPNGTEIQFTKTPGLTTFPKKNVTYFVVGTSENGFEVALTEGGAAQKVEGAALNTTETLVNRPNAIELGAAAVEPTKPLKVEGGAIDLSSSELNPALITVEHNAAGAIEGEGSFTTSVPVNAQVSFGIYACVAKWQTSGGT